MATRKNLIDSAVVLFEEAGRSVTKKEIMWLLQEAASVSDVDLVADPDAQVSDLAQEKFNAFLERRMRREPVQYILGRADFYGLQFHVNPSVLIPRPETELLVERALSRAQSRTRVVDIGTGSGCIAIAIKNGCPDSTVVGVDISIDALDTARGNAALNNTTVEWVVDDLFEPGFADRVQDYFPDRQVDLFISNPPYVFQGERNTLEAEVVEFEPHLALFAPTDALEVYRTLARLGRQIIAPGGYALLEIHAEIGLQVKSIFVDAGYSDVCIISDLAGRDRIVEARI